MTVASAVDIYVDVAESQDDLNFQEFPFVVFGFNITDGDANQVDLRTFHTSLYGDTVYVKIVDSNGIHESDATLEFDCVESIAPVVLNRYSNWNDNGWAIIELDVWTGNNNQTIGTQNDEGSEIAHSQTCNVSIANENATVMFYFPLWTASCQFYISQVDLYSVPDTAMANIVSGANNVTTSGFALMDMILAISAVVLLVFLIIFAWVLIEYMAHRVSKINKGI